MTLKIVGLTLTIRAMATMTTDNRFEVVSNVFVRNGVFNIPRKQQAENQSLSAALRLYGDHSLQCCHAKGLADLHDRITENLPGYTAWLVISTGGKVRQSRIIQYYGLWRALEKNGVPLPQGERTKEYYVSDSQGVQYFGAIRLDNPQFIDVVQLISLRSAVHVVMSSNEECVLKLLTEGWEYDSRKFPLGMLRFVERESMFFMIPVGEFDDHGGGAVALAQPRLIRECFP